MSLFLSLAGAWFGALFLIALAADITSWWKCARCGEPADHPTHYACVGRNAARCPHHRYVKPAWPFVVIGALMLVDVVAFQVVR